MTQESKGNPKINLKKALLYILQLIVIGYLGWYLYQNRDLFVLIKNIQWQHILLVVLLDTASFLTSSFINYSMLTRLDPRVTFIDSLMLQYVNSLLNKILPTIGGGAAFRAIYLKKKYQFPYTQFASTVTGLYVISFSTTSLIGIFCLLWIYLQLRVFNWVIFLAFVGILLPTLVVMLFTIKVPDSNRRLLRILKSTVDSWNIIKKDTRLVFGYMAMTVLLLLLSTAYTYLGYDALGAQPSFIPMLYLSSLGIILAFLNFTPDGIGVKEGIYVFSENLVQIPQGILILGSLYLRGVSILTNLVIGGICYWILMRQLKIFENNATPLVENK